MAHGDHDERLQIRTDLHDKAAGLQRQAETAVLGDAIAELAARIRAATYELLVMIHQFDKRGGWGQGFKSCAHWLNWRTGLDRGLTIAAHPRPFTNPSAVGCSRLLGGSQNATLIRMTVKARVLAGRLILDEPTDLPEGTEVELLPLDPGDWLDETDRAKLHEALRQSDADVAAGRLVEADEILKELRSH